jgi:general secretion pathway protein E
MNQNAAELARRLSGVSAKPERFAVETVDQLLQFGESLGASDLHLLPIEDGRLSVLYRIDGVLEVCGEVGHSASNVVSRLKVMAELLTYQTDVPQEGRIRSNRSDLEVRVSTFPTIHGEKAVVRLFVGSGLYRTLNELGFSPDVDAWLREALNASHGVLLVCGPAGSGKTTTLYASLRHIISTTSAPRSVCTLEDPVEARVAGAAQSQMQAHLGFDYATGLKSLMRQDPEVIMVGEIRDRETASTVFQASLTGHLVLSSFHAGRSVEAVGRLLDMGIEPYVVRSGLAGILTQRLLRARAPDGGTGKVQSPFPLPQYSGRFVLAESFSPRDPDVSAAILRKAAVDELEGLATAAGMRTLIQRGREAIASGRTTVDEFYRVFGQLPE